jgi:hypothetical protein
MFAIDLTGTAQHLAAVGSLSALYGCPAGEQLIPKLRENLLIVVIQIAVNRDPWSPKPRRQGSRVHGR